MEHELAGPARKLRLQGLSCHQIADALDLSQRVVERLVADLSVPEWTRRPQAKDELRARARELRAKGWTYNEIVAELGVSKSSCSLWLRDMPAPPPRVGPDGRLWREQTRDMWKTRWEKVMRRRQIERTHQKLVAARDIGSVSQRELLIAGAMLYWAEGAKSKPWRRMERVVFINSDPDLIRLFLVFLRALGVTGERLALHLQIHESADVAGAMRYWCDVTGIPVGAFGKTTLKRHNPKTVRKNVGNAYHGCLAVRVRQSAELYRQIEGWVRGVVIGAVSERARCGSVARAQVVDVASLRRVATRSRVV